MKVVTERSIHIGEVATDRTLRLDAMVNILQETAILHTQQVGIELNSLLDSGRTWVLNKIAIDIDRSPKMDERMEVQTWSRSIQRFKGLRDYRLYVGGGVVASASTLWLYLDTVKRRPVRVPDNYQSLYGVDEKQATAIDLEKWQAPGKISPEGMLTITTRISDFDVNGHVNNVNILQYIQTAIARAVGGSHGIRNIRLAFLREISSEVREVQVGVERTGNSCLFQVLGDEAIFASGTVEVADISDGAQ